MYLPVVNLYHNNQEPLGIFFEKLFENYMVSVDTSKCEEVAYSEWEIVMGEGKDVEIIRWEIKGMVMLESYRLGQLTISLFMLLFSRILKHVKCK